MTTATITPFSMEGFRGLQSILKSRTKFKVKSDCSGLCPVKFCASPRFELLYIVSNLVALHRICYFMHFS